MNPQEIIYIPIGKLKPYPKNSRTHSPEQIEELRASLREFGWTNPVLIDKKNGIIAGHGRVEAAKLEGYEEVPCIKLDLASKQARAYVIGDNKLAEHAGWDMDILKGELEELLDLDFDLSKIGFDEEEIAKIIGGPSHLQSLPDAPTKNISFSLTPKQMKVVRKALSKSEDAGPFMDAKTRSIRSHALVRICENFIRMESVEM